MTPSFKSAVELILSHEGGYVFDPLDPGGETKFGISKRQYPDLFIKDITRDQAKEIYYKDYWQKIRGDKLPFGVALVMFDMAVNMGISATVKILQDIIGVKRDGSFGDMTLNAALRLAKSFLIEELTIKRILRYSELNGWPVYGAGWTRRAVEICSTALLTREAI